MFVEPIRHDMCPKSCAAYTGPFTELQKCPQCGAEQYDSQKLKYFYTIPVGPQLQALYRDPQMAERMQYRQHKTEEIIDQIIQDGNIVQTYEDVLNGSVYLDAVSRGDIGPNEITLLYLHTALDCWIYIWMVFELAPEYRYKQWSILPRGVVPGPRKPKNMDSFLFPGFHHIAALQKEGLRIHRALAEDYIKKQIYFVMGCADGPGSHHGAFPCRIFCGMKGRHKPGKSHYLPVLLKPNDYEFDGWGSDADYEAKLLFLMWSTGISRPLYIWALCGDSMHACTLNIGDILPKLWRGNLQCKNTDSVSNWPWAVAASKPFIPGSFDRPPRDIAQKVNTGYKAKEFQAYLYGLAPALLHAYLPKPYWQNFFKLVRAVRIILQRRIVAVQLVEAHRLFQEFAVEFERLYVQRRVNRIHFVCPCIHLSTEAPSHGPPCILSAWTMERMIGELVSELRLPSNPYHNLSEHALNKAQVNAIKAMLPELNDATAQRIPRGSQDIGDGFYLLRPKEKRARSYPRNLQVGNLVATFISDAESCLGFDTGDDFQVCFARWGRLLLPVGQIVQSAWKETVKEEGNVRHSRIRQGTIFLGLEIATELHACALVCLYSRPDAFMWEQSCKTVFSVTLLSETEGLRVVDVKSIVAVVSMQPHVYQVPGQCRRFFCVGEDRSGIDIGQC
ncbi:hypothetical protein K439DRAFT_1646904 [Ramaria rubella]|nr:hypothetical protein K439DRAFT_1646904 [Ramaria rubella]